MGNGLTPISTQFQKQANRYRYKNRENKMITQFKKAAENIWIGYMLPQTMPDSSRISHNILMGVGTGLSLYSFFNAQPVSLAISLFVFAGPLVDFHEAGREAMAPIRKPKPSGPDHGP
jgi:hypothetical protein